MSLLLRTALHSITVFYITSYHTIFSITLHKCQLKENREKQTASKIIKIAISSALSDSFADSEVSMAPMAENQAVNWEELRITTSRWDPQSQKWLGPLFAFSCPRKDMEVSRNRGTPKSSSLKKRDVPSKQNTIQLVIEIPLWLWKPPHHGF